MIGENVLISIIVPVYNVELYIEKCVISLINQIYKNIEIILVDDGSTDNSGPLCDLLAKNDKRIMVIHKNNGGVSSARNVGIDKARGYYLTFVDGDDMLSEDFLTEMLKHAVKKDSDFVFSTKCFSNTSNKGRKKTEGRLVSKEEATAMLLSPDIVVGCWNKLYKKSFLLKHEIRFSEDLFYGEGLRFITTVSQRANNTAVCDSEIYFYRRDNVDSATTVFNMKKYYNGEKSLNIIHDALEVTDKRVESMWLFHLCLFYVGAIANMRRYKVKGLFKDDYIRWKSFVKRNAFKCFFVHGVSFRRKMIVAVCGISTTLIAILESLKGIK